MAEHIERTKELKPCPFCGNTHIRIKRHSSYQFGEVWWDVRCLRCGAKIENRLFDTESDAVLAWNRRESAELPHADVAPVRNGMWIFGELDVFGAPVRCSECGYGADRVDPIMWTTYPGHRFCGCCGAKMDGGNDDDRGSHGERCNGETVLGV